MISRRIIFLSFSFFWKREKAKKKWEKKFNGENSREAMNGMEIREEEGVRKILFSKREEVDGKRGRWVIRTKAELCRCRISGAEAG